MTDAEVLDAEAEEVEEDVRHLPAVQAHEAMVARAEISVEELVAQADKIKAVMDAAMTEGIHYGKIRGTMKPTLLKPGAEKLNVVLRLAPYYKSEKTFHDGGHLTVVSVCTLRHISSDLVIAEGEGLCSTYEQKYAYRGEGRTCPSCGAVGTIKKSKYPPRSGDYEGASSSDEPGWYCHSKVGGCGRNYAAADPAITSQSGERQPNPDLPDTWNTVLKMADKRALIAAVLNGTAASDVFTQDADDPASGPDSAAGSGTTGAGGAAAPAAEAGSFSRENARDFDPGRDLMDGAAKPSADMAQNLGVRMKHLEPGLDWNAMIRQAWPGERTPEFWLRLSNCLEWITQIEGADQGDFPVAEHSNVIAGFAWAFEGAVVEIVELPPSTAALTAEQQQATLDAAGDDITFGE